MRHHKGQAADRREDGHRAHREPARRKMPRRSARIEPIKMPIGQPVEGHRRRPRSRHAEQDPHPVLDSPVPAVAVVRRQNRPRSANGSAKSV